VPKNESPTPQRRGVAIFGPTSSGKTAASLDIAEELRDLGMRPVVLNADSRQVYRGMDIGTSKTRPSEMRGVEHRLIDFATPDRPVTLERYATLARRALLELAEDPSAVPIVVGGTGTYIRAVVESWDLAGSASSRRALEMDFPPDQREDALRVLKRIDPIAARRVHPNNYDAILNAIVRRMATNAGTSVAPAPFSFSVFCMRRDFSDITARIETTLDRQLRAGLVEEVSGLAHHYGLLREIRRHGAQARNVVLHTHGYREFLEHSVSRTRPLRSFSRADVDVVRTSILDHIWSYAKRQRGWYTKQEHTSLVPDRASARSVARTIAARTN
jgi:tRNA dimethylallyltransferase